jgi:organic radical activating enzyme
MTKEEYSMTSEKHRIIEINNITDKISSTFCMAKWHHTTIYLQSGETHSCYHPAPHSIPLEEVLDNPSSLHNTNEKKSQRLEMLNGGKPAGCNYCWNIEKLGDDYISDRKERNSSIYTPKRYIDIKNSKWNDNINPQYIEISFGNECNFKCGYCHPKASSAYYKEIKQHGRYPTKNHGFGIEGLIIYDEETNPYVQAWWDWWPEVSKTLDILRITGGEPLLQTSTWRLLDDLDINPQPKLELNINSNFGIKPVLADRLTVKTNKLLSEGKIRDFKMFTSIDTWGEQAEYIRTGLDLEIWERNFHTFMQGTNANITFMITFNILSVVGFSTLLEKILEWRKQYGKNEKFNEHRVRFDTPHLKEPLQYDMNLLPKEEFMPYMQQHLEFMKNNVDDAATDKFTEIEYEKFRRVVDYMENTMYPEEKIAEGRKDFYVWFNEYDRRRNVKFAETFPEMTNFYELCKGYNE